MHLKKRSVEGELCVEVGVYAHISWETKCKSRSKVWICSYYILAFDEYLSQYHANLFLTDLFINSKTQKLKFVGHLYQIFVVYQDSRRHLFELESTNCQLKWLKCNKGNFCCWVLNPRECPCKTHFNTQWNLKKRSEEGGRRLTRRICESNHVRYVSHLSLNWCTWQSLSVALFKEEKTEQLSKLIKFQDQILELVSKELNHLAAILHVCAGSLIFIK